MWIKVITNALAHLHTLPLHTTHSPAYHIHTSTHSLCTPHTPLHTTYTPPHTPSAHLYTLPPHTSTHSIHTPHTPSAHLHRVVSYLGSGQFGTVEKGVWQSHLVSQEVAIKTLNPETAGNDRVKFLQEAAIMGQFSHPNVVKLHGIVSDGEPVRADDGDHDDDA